jgi:hypothetical protein
VPDFIQIETAVPISSTNGNTLTFLYPAGRSANDYFQSAGAVISVRDLQNQYNQNSDFSLAYGEGQVVLTVVNPNLVIPAVQIAAAPKPPFGMVRLQLPLNVDAANILTYPPRGGDVYSFT